MDIRERERWTLGRERDGHWREREMDIRERERWTLERERDGH